MATHSSILAGKFQGQRSLAGYSPWGGKESDMTGQLSMHARTREIKAIVKLIYKLNIKMYKIYIRLAHSSCCCIVWLLYSAY